MKKGHQPIRQKGKGDGVMVSGFLTPGGLLKVPDHISDEELLRPNRVILGEYSWGLSPKVALLQPRIKIQPQEN